MQTAFSPAQLADPAIAEAEAVLRKCVHCGFCTATCPTYVLLGDERDSPRGRITLIKEMLERYRPPSAEVVRHVDRCLSCLSCMTTCPSGVDYRRLVDTARARIEAGFRRPAGERLLRRLLARVLPNPTLFRLALIGALGVRPLGRVLPGRLGAMARLAPGRIPARSPVDRPQSFPAEGTRRMRVALLSGCAQPVLAPGINETTVRVLTRHGCEVVVARGMGCCGALVHHLGLTAAARRQAIANVAAWMGEIDALDAIVINASGCGSMVKDYGHLLQGDPEWGAPAARIAALARDVSEVLAELSLAPVPGPRPVVAYHAPCSLQHGQGLREAPKALITDLGYPVRDIPEGHLCCGSAGTYNLLQPALARRLAGRKAENIARTGAEVVAAGNIGCIVQIAAAADLPVVHPVALVDWATGGPPPPELAAGAGGGRS